MNAPAASRARVTLNTLNDYCTLNIEGVARRNKIYRNVLISPVRYSSSERNILWVSREVSV